MATDEQRFEATSDERAALAAQSQGYPVKAASAQHGEAIRVGAGAALGQIIPILRIDIRPTDVSPASLAGAQNMTRVLNSILNDENTRITAKDESGRDLGVTTFKEIFPQVQGPASDGSIQVEYAEQATLGYVGDLLWSLQWFFKAGILGVPRQVVSALLQDVGVSFILETYYKNWLASILDQLHQRGSIPGYTDEETGETCWELFTEVAGRNIVLRPLAKYRKKLRAGTPHA